MSIEPPHLVLHYLQVILLKLMFLSNILIRIRFLFIPLGSQYTAFSHNKIYNHYNLYRSPFSDGMKPTSSEVLG